MNLIDLIKQQQQSQMPATPENPTSELPADETSIDTNGDGEISPEELFSHFDTDGDGKMNMTDYCAHIMFHIKNPGVLKPYMLEAYKNMDKYNESCARLHKRLEETLMVSSKDPQKDLKVKNALNQQQDVDVVDANKVNQLKLKESKDIADRMVKLAGI